jgi:hypothetical protein
VTNWFRNLRQTARKRAKKMGDDDFDSYSYGNDYLASGSRDGTPFHSSSSSSANDGDDLMDLDGDEDDGRSDMGSEDDYEEAVTPSPESSPSPPPFTPAPVSRRSQSVSVSMSIDPASYADVEKFSGVRVEDALLLLSFHQHGVH